MPSPVAKSRSKARSAARLAAVQALYQREMENTPVPQLLHEFHQHRLGATIEDVEYNEADIAFFDDIVKGADARRDEIDRLIAAKLSGDWSLDRSMGHVLPASVWGSTLAATALVPAAREVGLADAWVGIEARAADDVPILGPVTGLDGLVIAAGFSGHGFQLSPAIGQVIAELIVEGAPGIPLDALHLSRFDGANGPSHGEGAIQRIG